VAPYRYLWPIAVLAVLLALIILLPQDVSSVYTPPVPSTPDYNETVVGLPGFAPLYGYVYGNNCDPGPSGCFLGGSNYSQVPVLSNSPEQPSGIYYVNNASELVDLSSAMGEVRVVATITPLYQNYSHYAGMIANEFVLPDGYDEALFYGTLAPGGLNLTVETVNLTTGAVEIRTPGVGVAAENQQVLLVAPETALIVSTEAFCEAVTCSATITGVDLATGATWPAANLPFFEANNIYWIPELHQLINVDAHGATQDLVEQWNETLGPEPAFALAANVSVDHGVVVNWVNGIAYNPSTGQLAYSAGGDGYSTTYVLVYNPEGLLGTAGEVRYVAMSLERTLTPQTLNGQQYVYTNDWVIGGFLNGTQYLFDPWNGTTVPTNEAFTDLSKVIVCDAECFLGQEATGPDRVIDFHASLALNDPFWRVVLAQAIP
jgi:hypothetical protein